MWSGLCTFRVKEEHMEEEKGAMGLTALQQAIKLHIFDDLMMIYLICEEH